MAAPEATTSSGLTPLLGSRLNRSFTILLTCTTWQATDHLDICRRFVILWFRKKTAYYLCVRLLADSSVPGWFPIGELQHQEVMYSPALAAGADHLAQQLVLSLDGL